MVKGNPYSKMSGMRGPDIFKEIDNVASVEDAQRIVTEFANRPEKVNSKNEKGTLLQHIIMQPGKHHLLGIVVEAMVKIPSLKVNQIGCNHLYKSTPFFMAICKYKQIDTRFIDPIYTLQIIKCLLKDDRTNINVCRGDNKEIDLGPDHVHRSDKIYCNTPLMYAIHFSLYEIAHLLMSNEKIDLNKVNIDDDTTETKNETKLVALNFAFQVHSWPRSEKTSKKNRTEALDFLHWFIGYEGVDLNKALELALNYFAYRIEFIEFLIKNIPAHKPIDINKLYISGFKTYTLLHKAALEGPKDLIIFLLQDPTINVNMENKVGMTALHLAILHNRIDIVKLFLEKKELNTNTGAIPPLMLAVKLDNIEIVKEILKSKSAKLQLGFQTGSALPEPARKILAHFSKPNSVAIVDSKTKQPIPVGITNQDITIPIGSTALSIAVQNANADMVQILLRNYEWDKGYLVSLLRTDAEIKINEYLYKPINELLSDHGNPAAKRRRPDVTEKALEAPESPEAPVEHEIIPEPAEQQVSSSQQQQQQQQTFQQQQHQ